MVSLCVPPGGKYDCGGAPGASETGDQHTGRSSRREVYLVRIFSASTRLNRASDWMIVESATPRR